MITQLVVGLFETMIGLAKILFDLLGFLGRTHLPLGRGRRVSYLAMLVIVALIGSLYAVMAGWIGSVDVFSSPLMIGSTTSGENLSMEVLIALMCTSIPVFVGLVVLVVILLVKQRNQARTELEAVREELDRVKAQAAQDVWLLQQDLDRLRAYAWLCAQTDDPAHKQCYLRRILSLAPHLRWAQDAYRSVCTQPASNKPSIQERRYNP